uniref:EF-hand domain-containing protein n=1 Tax=Alexandrium andersonii TaxID=327968 RepID=A0A7S2JB72_9DINO
MTSVMQGASKRTSVSHEGTLGLWDLVRLTAQCRAEIRLKVRQTFGLSEREIAELGRVFRRYDAQDTGIITGDNLIQILKEHQGMEQTSALERLEVVVGNLGAVMYGQVSFKDLLRAVRLLRDYTDWDDFRKRRRAFADLHLTDDEIEGFREVFQRFGTTTPGLVLFAEFKDMLSRVVPESSASDDMELARIVKLAVPDGTQAVLHGLDFPDFVRVMMTLQDKNWCEINGNASKIARDIKSGHYTSRRTLFN